MDGFLRLAAEERLRVCLETRERVRLPVESVEKDLWVCFALRELLQVDRWGRHLTFKGGTSLSKAWILVERLSEDIDIVVSREELGFAGDKGPESAKSRNKQMAKVEEVSKACRALTRDALLPSLRSRFERLLPPDKSWNLRLDDAGESILFDYPTVTGTPKYVPKVVKIELGARSDAEPTEVRTVVSFVSELFPEVAGSGKFEVPTVVPQRTFWEKSFLLHEEHVRNRPIKARLARHFYDLWSLTKAGVGAKALADAVLFRRVAAHRSIYFRVGGVDYKGLVPHALRLMPPGERMAEWKDDYDRTRESMVYGEAPEFEVVLRSLSELFAGSKG